MVRTARLLLIGVIVLVASGCIGATPRDEFEAEVRARGGGLSNTFLVESLDLIAVDVGGSSWEELDVLSLTAQPGNRTVVAAVRREDRRDFVDTVTVVDGEIRASTPLQDAGDLPLDDIEIPLSTVAIEDIEEISQAALEAFDDPGGFVEAITITRAGDVVTITVDVESDRQTATASFDADGTFRGIE